MSKNIAWEVVGHECTAVNVKFHGIKGLDNVTLVVSNSTSETELKEMVTKKVLDYIHSTRFINTRGVVTIRE